MSTTKILNLIKSAVTIITALILWSCAVPPAAEKQTTAKPEIALQIASLNLGNLNKRIERKHIVELVKILQRERIEILAIQGLSRYPGVSTRVDFVDELSGQTEWRSAFGEMENISGRQTGNAIFSLYPIVSYYNQTFDNIPSAKFEAALGAIVDAGIRTIKVVSTQLPLKSTSDEQAECIKLIIGLTPSKNDPLIIITGNLPSLEIAGNSGSLNEVLLSKPAKGLIPKIWYSSNDSSHLQASKAVETELGTLVIAELGLFQ